MNKYLIQQISACLCKPGKQEPSASLLTDAQLLEVFDRLRRGQNPNEIGRYAQKNWNFMADRTSHTVGQSIRKLQRRVAHLITPVPQAQAETPAHGPLSAAVIPVKVSHGEIIETLDRLYIRLRERSTRLMEEERSSGRRYKELARDAKASASLGNLLSQLEEFELLHAEQLKGQQVGEEEQERLSAQHQLVERSLCLLEQERTTGILYKESAKDVMAIVSSGKSLQKIRRFEVINADLLKAQREEKENMIIKAGFDKIVAKDEGKSLIAFLKWLVRMGEEHGITLEEAAEKCGMTPEEFTRKHFSPQQRQAGERKMTVNVFGMIANMDDEGLDILVSAMGKVGGWHQEDMDTETLRNI